MRQGAKAGDPQAGRGEALVRQGEAATDLFLLLDQIERRTLAELAGEQRREEQST